MYKNILVPVVFDEEHDSQASYKAARTLADDDAKFTVLHVMESIPAYVTAGIPAELLENSRKEIKSALIAAAAELPGSKAELVSGHAGTTIVDYAKEHDVDCIVVASHVPGIANLLLGSTADRVVRHAPCSVHVIR